MQLKLVTSRATANGTQNAGDVIEVETDEALRMVEAGQAEIVREVITERAIKTAKAEKAVL